MGRSISATTQSSRIKLLGRQETDMLDVLMLFPSSGEVSEIDDFIAGFVADIKPTEGLRSLRVSTGDVMSRGARPPFNRVVELSFDSLDNWMAWVLAPARAPNQDAPERAAKGAALERLQPLILFFDVAEPV
jgi:hypothetical protein